MAHITEFKIEGLAGRTKPYHKKLNRDVNVFFGLNGAGKTSILRILRSAMAWDISILDDVPFKRAEVKIYSIDSDRVFTYAFEKPPPEKRSVELLETPMLPSPQGPFLGWGDLTTYTTTYPTFLGAKPKEWQVTPPAPKTVTHWNHGWLPTSRLYYGIVRNSARTPEINSEQALDVLFQDALTILWSSYSARLLSEVRRAQEAGLSNILQVILGPESKAEPERRLDAATAHQRVITFLNRQGAGGKLGSLDDFSKRYANDSRIVSVAEHIDRVETDIESATAPRARLQELIQRMFSGPKKVSFTDTNISVLTDDGRDIGLKSLSSGEKQALRIFAEALFVKNSTLLIDEPEISLHIDWQRELIKSIQILSPEAQIIAATHSPEIMAEIDDKYIHRL